MLPILDTNKLEEAEAELGLPCEQLLTPLTRYARVRKEHNFAIDNGAFTSFNEQGFRSLLEREKTDYHLCRFVTVPDVVGSAIRTMEVFERWEHQLHPWPIALVAQDGLEDMTIPWDRIAAIFIGGTTRWKLSNAAAQIIKTAQILKIWSHVGRVNTPGRFEYFDSLGTNSFDGSGLARFSDMRRRLYEKRERPRLFPI